MACPALLVSVVSCPPLTPLFLSLFSRIDTPGVIQRVSKLFHGNPPLIQGFNTFLPAGYRIDINTDPAGDPHSIIVTTPMGTTTQSTMHMSSSVQNALSRQRDIPGFGPNLAQPFPYVGIPAPTPTVNTLPPLGAGLPVGSRSMTPQQPFHLGAGGPLPAGPGTPYEPGFSPGFGQNQQTTAAASFLGGLNKAQNPNQVEPAQQQPPGEFNHAIQYLNKIKARYSDDTNAYKQFLDILQTYQKEQRHLQDVRMQSFVSFDHASSFFCSPKFTTKFRLCSRMHQTCWQNSRISCRMLWEGPWPVALLLWDGQDNKKVRYRVLLRRKALLSSPNQYLKQAPRRGRRKRLRRKEHRYP